MTEEQQQIREILVAEIAKTEAAVAEYTELTKPVAPDEAIGRVSRMDAINNRSVIEAALRTAEDKLNKLRYVLGNLERPDFGICQRCKKPIPLGRILIKPESVYCVHCAR